MSRTVAVAQLGYFIGHAQHTTGLFVMLGLCVSHGGCIAQLGYFIAAHNWVFHAANNWVICHAGFESRTVTVAQLGYFIAAHNWVISCSSQLGYLSCWVRVSHY